MTLPPTDGFDALERLLSAATPLARMLHESPSGAFLNLPAVEADIANALRAVRWARPKEECGCKGGPCVACEGNRWLCAGVVKNAKGKA